MAFLLLLDDEPADALEPRRLSDRMGIDGLALLRLQMRFPSAWNASPGKELTGVCSQSELAFSSSSSLHPNSLSLCLNSRGNV